MTGPDDAGDAIRRARATQKAVFDHPTVRLANPVPPLHKPIRKSLNERGTVTLPEPVLKRWFRRGSARNLTGLVSSDLFVVFPTYASSASRRPPALVADLHINEVVVSGSQITVPLALRKSWMGTEVVLLDCGDFLVVSPDAELGWRTSVGHIGPFGSAPEN